MVIHGTSPNLQAHWSCWGYGASREGSWEHRHVLSVTEPPALPFEIVLLPYHRQTPPCSLHPAPTLSQTGSLLPRIPLPAVAPRHSGVLASLGTDPMGEQQELQPLCAFPCLALGIPQPWPRATHPCSPSSWQSLCQERCVCRASQELLRVPAPAQGVLGQHPQA